MYISDNVSRRSWRNGRGNELDLEAAFQATVVHMDWSRQTLNGEIKIDKSIPLPTQILSHKPFPSSLHPVYFFQHGWPDRLLLFFFQVDDQGPQHLRTAYSHSDLLVNAA
jgi:hypothetical protein